MVVRNTSSCSVTSESPRGCTFENVQYPTSAWVVSSPYESIFAASERNSLQDGTSAYTSAFDLCQRARVSRLLLAQRRWEFDISTVTFSDMYLVSSGRRLRRPGLQQHRRSR